MGLFDSFKKSPREKAREDFEDLLRQKIFTCSLIYSDQHNVKDLSEIFEYIFNEFYEKCVVGMQYLKNRSDGDHWKEAYEYLEKVNNIPDLLILMAYVFESKNRFDLDEIFDDYRIYVINRLIDDKELPKKLVVNNSDIFIDPETNREVSIPKLRKNFEERLLAYKQ